MFGKNGIERENMNKDRKETKRKKKAYRELKEEEERLERR